MANTPNYGLLKPDRTDNINDVDTSLANNFTTIDTEIKNRKDEIDGHIAGTNGQHTSEVITHADGNVKTTLENHEARLGSAETELTDHEGRLTDIETLGLDLLGPDVENRIATLESDIEGVLAPATFDAMNQQGYTFDEYRIGYVENALVPINASLADIVTVNVKLYGAKGDGVTNDKTAIQNAINYVASIGGGIVLIPNGTFMANSIEVKTGVTIKGNGYKSQVKSNLINSQIFINRTAYSDICLENFRITGYGNEDSANGDNDICIDIWNATRLKIRNMFVENGRGHGIYIRGCDSVHIHDIYCKDFHEQGVAVTTGNNIVIENIIGDYAGATLNTQALVDIEANAGDVVTNLIIKNVISKTPGVVGLNLYCWTPSKIDKVTVSDIYTDILVVNGITNGLFNNLFVTGRAGIEALSIYSCSDLIFNNVRVTDSNIISTKLKMSNNERVSINGISIEGSNETTAIAVDILSSNHSKINNMHIENAGSFGVRLRNSDSFEFNGLEIEGAVNYGIALIPTTSNAHTRISGLRAYNCGVGIYLEATNNDVYADGDVTGCTTPVTVHASNVGTLWAGTLIGYRSAKYGTTNVSAGVTQVTVSHNLGRTPLYVGITPQSSNLGNYFVSGVNNGTSFNVNFPSAPASAGSIMWRVEG